MIKITFFDMTACIIPYNLYGIFSHCNKNKTHLEMLIFLMIYLIINAGIDFNKKVTECTVFDFIVSD